MRIGNRWVGILVAVAGMTVCLAGLLGFLLGMANSTLPWHPGQTIREYYQTVGQSFSEGFTVGFFLCFFMVLVVVAAWPHVFRASPQAHVAPVPSRETRGRRTA